MSTIQDFYNVAILNDFSRLHQFRLISWFWNGASVIGDDDLHLYLETASLPSREITNVPVPFMGLNFNVPGLATYGGSSNYPVVFRSDSSYWLRRMIERATRLTFDDQTSVGDYNTPGYDSRMVIGLLDKVASAAPVEYYTLVGTQLINTGTIEYNLGDTGQVARVNGSLTYHYWHRGLQPGDQTVVSDAAAPNLNISINI